jgi:hypothetical protein
MLRFSPVEVEPGQLLSNVERLAAELGDAMGVVEALEEAGVVTRSQVLRKKLKIEKFMAHSAYCGTLEGSEVSPVKADGFVDATTPEARR